MSADEVKTKLEGIKWINKEIEGLYLELAALESGNQKARTEHYQSTNKQSKYGRE